MHLHPRSVDVNYDTSCKWLALSDDNKQMKAEDNSLIYSRKYSKRTQNHRWQDCIVTGWGVALLRSWNLAAVMGGENETQQGLVGFNPVKFTTEKYKLRENKSQQKNHATS